MFLPVGLAPFGTTPRNKKYIASTRWGHRWDNTLGKAPRNTTLKNIASKRRKHLLAKDNFQNRFFLCVRQRVDLSSESAAPARQSTLDLAEKSALPRQCARPCPPRARKKPASRLASPAHAKHSQTTRIEHFLSQSLRRSLKTCHLSSLLLFSSLLFASPSNLHCRKLSA